MNKELIAYIGLIGYGLYTIVQNRISGSDMNLEFYARSIGPIGFGGWLCYQNVIERLKIIGTVEDKKSHTNIVQLDKPKSPDKEQTIQDSKKEDENMTKVDELSISELEQEDYRALTYLAKRLAKLQPAKQTTPATPDSDQKVRGVKLLKDLNDVFYEIHKSEAE